MRYILLLIIFLSADCYAQKAQRIESEYKLALPTAEVDGLWDYLQSDAFIKAIDKRNALQPVAAVEMFEDVYFDTSDEKLYKQKVGLRYRKRYLRDSLIKSLVQLKTPLQSDGVARTEIKYEVKRSTDLDDIYARHSLLRYIKKRDREDLKYQLRSFGVSLASIRPAVSLLQERRRVYLSDTIGAFATCTLDIVSSDAFPYPKYAELELELNEVRYTNASEQVQQFMEEVNQALRDHLQVTYPMLVQDQTPKYNKMRDLIAATPMARLYSKRMWVILSVMLLFASYTMIKGI